MSSIDHFLPDLIVGQGSVGFSLSRHFSKFCPNLLTWSKSGRHRSTFQGDIGAASNLPALGTVMILLSPCKREERDYRVLYEESLPNFLSQIKAKRVLFCSSTVVYEQKNVWYSEISDTSSENFRARSLLVAEKAIQHYYPNAFLIFRVSGLVDTEKQLRDRAQRSPYKWINYLYRSDLISVLEQSYFSSLVGIYNVTRSPFFCGENRKSGKRVCHLKILSSLKIKLK